MTRLALRSSDGGAKVGAERGGVGRSSRYGSDATRIQPSRHAVAVRDRAWESPVLLLPAFVVRRLQWQAWCSASVVLMVLSGCQTIPVGTDSPAPRVQHPTENRTGEPGLANTQAAPAPLENLAHQPAERGSAVGADTATGPVAMTADATPPEPPPIADLWDRLRRGHGMADLDHPLVAQHAQRFAQSRYFELRADRIRLYLPLIVEELQARRMPLELAMLPLVESALNPHARSHVGATGPWQFMAPTARRFELRQSRLVDDRKNLQAATRAALTYLETLHAQFGDWHLAMAAYNWGEGRVATAVARQRATGQPADFVALSARMPAETRNYVPQIMALAAIVDDPARFGATLPEVPDGNPLTEVDIDHDIDLDLAVRFSGMGRGEFLALNPSVKPPLVLAHATPRLLLPQDAADRFSAALRRHPGQTASWRAVRLARTQTVDAVARQHGASAAVLREINGIPKGSKPVAGSVLLVPHRVARGAAVDSDMVAQASLRLTPDVVRISVLAKPGETPRIIAKRHRVPVADLLRWNRLPARSANKPLRKRTSLALWVARK